MKYVIGSGRPFILITPNLQVHHILAEIIQGGLVLETNVEEIDVAGTLFSQVDFPPISRFPQVSPI